MGQYNITFRRPTNRFSQVALYFLLFILIVDSYFALFMRLCLSAQECAHLMVKILLGLGSSEIGMSTNIAPTTLSGNSGDFTITINYHITINYYHKWTLSLGQPCQNTFFLNCNFPLCNISFLFVLLISVFLTLKSNSYGSTKHLHILSFLVAIINDMVTTVAVQSFDFIKR